MQKQKKIDEITDILRTRIRDGYYGIEGQLPTKTKLGQEFGLAKETTNQMLLRLQGEGYVIATSNRHLHVVMPRRRVPMTDKSFVQFLEGEGLVPLTEYLELPQRTPMNSTIARIFGVPVGTPYIARIRRDGTPQMWYRTTSKYYLADLIDDTSLRGMQQDDRYDVIEDIYQKRGIEANFLDDDTIARLPNVEEQQQLGITHITPVMESTRTGYEQKGGRVLWFNRIIMVAHLFVLHQERSGPQRWTNTQRKTEQAG